LAVKLQVNPNKKFKKTRLYGGFFYIYARVKNMGVSFSRAHKSTRNILYRLELA
jgi:peptidyl-tRNA hydrolase